MTDAILVLNAGSSSVKYAVYGLDEDTSLLMGGQVDRIGIGPQHHADGQNIPLPVAQGAGHDEILHWLTGYLKNRAKDLTIRAAGHRVVHGGRDFAGSTVLDPQVRAALTKLSPLAPNHQPHNLAGIAALEKAWPEMPQVAAFDTAFHRSQSRLAQLFALPRHLSDEGILRYGFHGLSYDYITSQLPDIVGEKADGKVIVLHLGNGASICAMENRQSVATTMGFTALDGLVMGRRCGEIDPGVIFHLMRAKGMSVNEVESMLSKESGMLGVSGQSSDMRDLLASDDPAAREAVDLFIYRAVKQIGALSACLGGLDALVFTGGIGENSAQVRAGIIAGSAWLGAGLDGKANDRNGPRISGVDASVSAWVIPTNEEKIIAKDTREVLQL